VFKGRERHTPEQGGERVLPLRRVLARESRCSTSGCPVAAMQLQAKGRGRPAASVAHSLRHQFLCGVFHHAEIAHRSCTAATRTGVANSTAEIAHRICTAAAAAAPQGARLPTSAAKFQPAQAVTVRGSGQKNQTGLARSDWGPSDARARGYRLRPVCQRCCYVHSRCG
jgi:hypothetical protein